MFIYFNTSAEAEATEAKIHAAMLQVPKYYASKWSDIVREVRPQYSNGVGNPLVGKSSGRYGVAADPLIHQVLTPAEIVAIEN